MTSKKMINSLAIAISTISATALLGYSFSQILVDRVETSITKNNEIGWTREDEELNVSRYLRNALEQDAVEKAQTDSVLFYKISTNGVITRFSVVAHIMKVLELNPNKEIRVFAIDALNLDETFFNQKDKFPNVKFKYFDQSFLESSVDTFAKYDFNLEFLEEVYNEFGDDKKIDGYFDDYSFFNKINLYLSGVNTPANRLEIYNEFSLLSKLESTNFISDGTLSVEFFEQTIKRAFLLSNNLYDSEISNYENAKLMREAMKQGKISEEEFIDGNNALLFLTSLITYDTKNPNSTKYFLPTTDFIGELNRPTGNNYKYGSNDIFSPYNSQNLDVISLIRQLNQDDVKRVLKIENFDPEIFIEKMKGNDNYIFAGTLLSSPSIVASSAKSLLAIRNYAKKTTLVENHNKIVVWFKGHPRDGDDILEKLQNGVKEITNGADDGSWIRVLDHKIPFEFYSIFNVFSSDISDPNPSNHKRVFIFTTYSTLVLMTHASNQLDPLKSTEIAKILVDEASIYSFERITKLYGEDSKIFPKDKLTTLANFENENS
ncbi:MAG: hypothetical protein ACRC1F_02340 [Metamycoplasmataceae bacterium]